MTFIFIYIASRWYMITSCAHTSVQQNTERTSIPKELISQKLSIWWNDIHIFGIYVFFIMKSFHLFEITSWVFIIKWNCIMHYLVLIYFKLVYGNKWQQSWRVDPSFKHCVHFKYILTGFNICISVIKRLKYIIERVIKKPSSLIFASIL